jgi:NAD(P)-dependent dehydrogenase (short-subunit alcohol dehydrogenase family)
MSVQPVVIITGAGRGIGRATAEEFAAAGYAVVIAERVAARGRSAAKALRGKGANVVFVHADVAKPGAAERAIRAAITRLGRLDCVVNNAGVLTTGRLDRLSQRAIREMIEVNLLGCLLVARAALPVLRRRRRATRGRRICIINVASLLGTEGLAEFVPYCATKFGVIGLTSALADELRGTRIATWAVCPGAVDTPLAKKAGATNGSDMIPPEKVARVIVALATGRRRVRSGGTVDVTR